MDTPDKYEFLLEEGAIEKMIEDGRGPIQVSKFGLYSQDEDGIALPEPSEEGFYFCLPPEDYEKGDIMTGELLTGFSFVSEDGVERGLPIQIMVPLEVGELIVEKFRAAIQKLNV